MASVTTFSTPSASPINTGGTGLSSNNSLYLFTFLTTLFLLLGISCGIIFRALLLRRRYRARLQQAIDAGILLPDGSWPIQSTNPRAVHLGEKPTMWDVSMYGEKPKAFLDDGLGEHFQWKDVMPISTTLLRTIQPKPILPTTITNNTQPPRIQRHRIRSIRKYIQSLLCGYDYNPMDDRDPTFEYNRNTPPVYSYDRSQSFHVHHSNMDPMQLSQPQFEGDPDKVLVSFLIALPNPLKPLYQAQAQPPPPSSLAEESTKPKGKSKSIVVIAEDNYEDEPEMDLPDIVFGVSEMNWKYGKLERSDEEGTPTGAPNSGAGGEAGVVV